MREIPLTKGFVAIVDDEDYEDLSRFNWCVRSVYACRKKLLTEGGNGKQFVSMHHLILPPSPGMVVDHINGNPFDNRRSNLRLCTQSQNAVNQGTYGKSGFKGVYKDTKATGWNAIMRVNGKIKHLGYFAEADDAARCFDEHARTHHGQFARLNFPREGEQSARSGGFIKSIREAICTMR